MANQNLGPRQGQKTLLRLGGEEALGKYLTLEIRGQTSSGYCLAASAGCREEQKKTKRSPLVLKVQLIRKALYWHSEEKSVKIFERYITWESFNVFLILSMV